MRQTQYDKMVNAVNKFDTQRIKKAIKEGKIQTLMQTEKNNPALSKMLSQPKQSRERKKKRHIDSPDNEKIMQARKRKEDFISKQMMHSTIDVDYRKSKNRSTRNFDNNRKTIDLSNTDVLTPFELKNIKQKLNIDSYRTSNNLSLPRMKQHGTNLTIVKPNESTNSKLSSLSRMQMSGIGAKINLSPRLEEFYTFKKDQITKILADSEKRK
jgi:signal recognition particle subunit SEC65